MTMDEVLRMDIDKALVILRGKKVLEVDKYDYSKHPEAKNLRASKAASHVPDWQSEAHRAEQTADSAPPKPKPLQPKDPTKKAEKPSAPAKAEAPAPPVPDAPAKRPAQKSGQQVVTTTKDSILSKPKKEE